MKNQINNLITKSSGIVKKYHYNMRANGEFFNLYSLLGIEHRENETHSILLVDLLSPQGSHGQKGLFLKLFLDYLKLSSNGADYAKVNREYPIGKIDKDYTEGGRIDILIEINDRKILIENKLYAKDQENQLERYHRAFPDATVLYLSIDGKEYQNKVDFEYTSISYEKDINKWLELVLDQISDKPYLQNSIKQYYNLVKNISFTGYTQEMEKEISQEITSTTETLDAAYQIYYNYESAIRRLIKEKLVQLEIDMKEIGLTTLEESSGNNCYFTNDIWRNNNFCLGIEFEKNTIFIGITYINHEQSINIGFNNKVKERFPINNPTDYWPTFKYLSELNNFYLPETSKLLLNGEFNRIVKEGFTEYKLFIDNILN